MKKIKLLIEQLERLTNKKVILKEAYINLLKKEEKEKYVDIVWDILQKSYAPLGGYKSVASKDELINDSFLWKLIKKDNKIITVAIYKDKFGRKGMGKGSDGSVEGKRGLIKIIEEDIKLNRSWGEVSGKLAEIMIEKGAIPVPNTMAAKITGKNIISLNPDGYHYTRMIGGQPHEKIIVTGISEKPYDKFGN